MSLYMTLAWPMLPLRCPLWPKSPKLGMIENLCSMWVINSHSAMMKTVSDLWWNGISRSAYWPLGHLILHSLKAPYDPVNLQKKKPLSWKLFYGIATVFSRLLCLSKLCLHFGSFSLFRRLRYRKLYRKCSFTVILDFTSGLFGKSNINSMLRVDKFSLACGCGVFTSFCQLQWTFATEGRLGYINCWSSYFEAARRK